MDRQSKDPSLPRPKVSRSQPPGATGAPLRGPGSGDERRSLALSYGLWCLSLVGICGIHRVYNRKPLTGFLWLFTFGLCGIGQLVDLFLIPGMVEGVNRQLNLPPGSVAAGTPIDRQLLRLARQVGEKGFTINDALIELDLPLQFDSGSLQEEIDKLLQMHLLDVGNDERGRVIYREP
jgi:TM2 domain-containing membrane protein YozV